MASSDRISRVEAAFFNRTLAGFLTSYVGESAVVDLVNESTVAGRIQEIDAFMTVTMSNVVLIDQRGKYHLLDEMVVASRKIRQIQLPKLVDGDLLRERLQNQLAMLKQGSVQPEAPKRKAFRKIHAERMQKETLQENNLLRAGPSSE